LIDIYCPTYTDSGFEAPFRKRSLKRDTNSVLNKNHKGTLDPEKALADESYVFNSTTCAVLNPEGEIGPFYFNGEYVREDLREDEPGVEIILDAQIIDVSNLRAPLWCLARYLELQLDRRILRCSI
jgi:hypothetical protein